MPQDGFRLEHDLLGDLPVPSHGYWGIHTERARANFPISGRTIGQRPDLVNALAAVKEAAAGANHGLGLLHSERWAVILEACADIRDGSLHDQFVADLVQGGAGTSTNMNANEVIANRALELLGLPAVTMKPCTPTSTSTCRSRPATSTPRRSGLP